MKEGRVIPACANQHNERVSDYKKNMSKVGEMNTFGLVVDYILWAH